ncbi:MAG: adenosylcobinamide-GDP ribazoletransferase [Clostridia bacterium]|nr:adenosylcobinamide-GDP ribazoletransferase [Clostridia bacterium]
MKKQLQAFLTALQFLTRLRISILGDSADTFQQSITYFPLVGLILGIILAIVWYFLSFIDTEFLRAALLLALSVFLSGGLHMDGFMDSMDGLFSGRERERILEIMKDSNVGAHGVSAAIILMLLKFTLLLSLPNNYLEFFGLSLSPFILLMPVLGRWAMVPAVTCFPYARKKGIGGLFRTSQGIPIFIIATLVTFLICWFVMGTSGLILLFGVSLLVLVWCNWIKKILGGLTGDTYGALSEITEVFILLLGLMV